MGRLFDSNKAPQPPADRFEAQTRRDESWGPDHYPGGLLEFIQQIVNYSRRTAFADTWRGDTIPLTAGQGRQLVGANKQRARVLIWTDSANTSPVYVSPTPVHSAPATGNTGCLLLAPSSAQLELLNSGAIYVYSTADASIQYIAEYLASPS